MRRLIRFAAALYPKSWRERYGAEFAVLLEDVKPDWRTVLDTLEGALRMQLKTWKPRRIMLAAGLAGMVAALITSFAITTPDAQTIITVAGPADAAAAREAVLSLAKRTFKHPSPTYTWQAAWLGSTPAFDVAFTFNGPLKGWPSWNAFVRENAQRSGPEKLQILAVRTEPANLPFPKYLLVALIGLGVTGWAAWACTLAFTLQASRRTV